MLSRFALALALFAVAIGCGYSQQPPATPKAPPAGTPPTTVAPPPAHPPAATPAATPPATATPATATPGMAAPATPPVIVAVPAAVAPPVAAPPAATPPAAAPAAPAPAPAAPAQAPAPAATPPQAPAWPTQVLGRDLAGWIKELKESPDGSVREMAVKVIPMFGPTARGPALKPLVSQLYKETDPGVRMNLIIVLGNIGAEKPEEARQIVEALSTIIGRSGPGSPVRLHAARSLQAYGTIAASAIPILLTIDEDPAWETRQSVMIALSRIAKSPEPKKGPNLTVLNAMIRRLPKEESAAVRLEIAQALLTLGPPTYNKDIPGDYEKTIRPYYEVVMKKLETETDEATRVWLMMDQMYYDGRALTDANILKIADAINKPDYGGKVAALRALGMLGERAKPALPTILSALKWTDRSLLFEALCAVAALKTLAIGALPDLQRIKAGDDEYLRLVAAEAIEHVTGKRGLPPAPPPPAVAPKK